MSAVFIAGTDSSMANLHTVVSRVAALPGRDTAVMVGDMMVGDAAVNARGQATAVAITTVDITVGAATVGRIAEDLPGRTTTTALPLPTTVVETSEAGIAAGNVGQVERAMAVGRITAGLGMRDLLRPGASGEAMDSVADTASAMGMDLVMDLRLPSIIDLTDRDSAGEDSAGARLRCMDLVATDLESTDTVTRDAVLAAIDNLRCTGAPRCKAMSINSSLLRTPTRMAS
jgi:hypothetical protein